MGDNETNLTNTTTSTPKSSFTPKDQNSNLGFILGGIAGGFVAFALGVGAFFSIKNKRKRRQNNIEQNNV